MKKKHKYILIIFFFIVFFEIILRAFGWGDPPIAVLDPHIEYYPKPSTSFNRYGNLVKINSYGMRSNEIDHLNPGPFHISLLGDSIVYGNHQLDQKETIAYKLEKKMQNHIDDAVKVSAIAASSWGPQNIEAFLEKKGPFHGKFAIVIQSSHDRFDIKNDHPSIKPPYRLNKSYTAIGDFIERLWEWVGNRYQVNRSSSDQNFSDKQEITKQSLLRLINKLKKSYSNVVLYYHVSKQQIESKNPDQAMLFYQQLATQQGIGFIDSTELYKNTNCKEPLYLDNLHFTSQGTECASEILFHWIKRYI